MQQRRFGRTNLMASVAGLGCGGPSRLGMRFGASEADAASLVQLAIDLGVNYVDTAESYGTERAVGLGIAGRRDTVIISSKVSLHNTAKALRAETELLASLDGSLKNLGTDRIDVYHLHGVTIDQLHHVEQIALPALTKARDAGKLRHIAVSEFFAGDTSHKMLQALLITPMAREVDVVMVGFNLLNPSARHTVFPLTQKHGIATEIMFAVRKALSQPEALRQTIAGMMDRGEISPGDLDPNAPLGFLGAGAASIIQAAYRFCAHEPGAGVVLFGTGNADHLRANIESLSAGPLPKSLLEQLRALFGNASGVSGS